MTFTRNSFFENITNLRLIEPSWKLPFLKNSSKIILICKMDRGNNPVVYIYEMATCKREIRRDEGDVDILIKSTSTNSRREPNVTNIRSTIAQSGNILCGILFHSILFYAESAGMHLEK